MKTTRQITLVLIAILSLVLLLTACEETGNSLNSNGDCVHQYDKWTIAKEPACSNEGVQSRTCQQCGYMETQTLAALGHTIAIDQMKNATCTESGLTEGKHCSVCNETIAAQEIVPALGHTEVIDNGQNATCTTTGLTEGKHCSVCNEIIIDQQTIPALGHTEVVDKAAKNATCTETGLTEQKHCSVCNAVLSNQTVIVAKGHIKVVDASAKSATCTDAGWSESSHCSVCNVVLSEKKTIKATGHIESVDKAKAATCTQSGLTEGKHCSVCKYVIVKQNTVAAKGHKVVVDKAVSATCTSTGLTEGSHCSACNATLVRQSTVAKLSSHTYVSGVCKHCGKSDSNYVPTYSAGETWTVAGRFEFSIDSVVEHILCSSYRNEKYGFSNMYGVMVNYHYKNLGYDSLEISYSKINVYDEETEKATVYSSGIWCDHEKESTSCMVGTKASASYVYALSNKSSKVSIYVSIKETNGTTHKAQFVVNVKPVEDEPKEDNLNGCKITLEASLPKTISYYTYSGSKQSSCSITEVSFEVSGDDLYIYFTGRKTYDSRGSGQSDSCKIGWKLYDNNNNVIASGTAYTLSIAVGEGFVKTKDRAYDCITAGKTYKLVILNVN